MTVSAREQPRARPIPWVPIAIGVLILILVVMGIWAYLATRPETTLVAKRDVVVTLPLGGEAVAPPTERAEIMAPYRAPVARVFASVGDRVSEGDVLVELSYPSVQAAYDRAQKELQAARQALQQARQQYSQQLTAARKQLEAARTVEQRARQAVAPAAAAENAEGAAAIEVTPETTPDLQQATEARIAAEQELLQLQSEMEATLTPHRQRLEAAQQAFQQAQAGRKVAQVRSPIAGTVLTLNARPGQEVGEKEGTPVAVVVDLSALQVHAPVDPSETAIRRGVPVNLTFEAIEGREFEGDVDRIVTRPARPLRGEGHLAIISFKNEQGLVKPEMKAHARVIVSEARNVVAVPSDAVDRDEADRPVVQVLRDGTWQSVVVQPGLSDGQYTVIRSGLEEGETIKVTPDLL